jgi:hypothetical protein
MTSPFQTGARSTPEALVALIEHLVNPSDEDVVYPEPSQEQIDGWLIGMMEDRGEE